MSRGGDPRPGDGETDRTARTPLGRARPDDRPSRRPAGDRAPVPISRTCPGCGEAGYRAVRPRRLIAFAKDRVCLGCGARYAPPTPGWAAAVFLLGGGFLLLAGLAGLVVTTIALVFRHSPDPIGMVLSGAITVLGALAARHGVRALLSPGRV